MPVARLGATIPKATVPKAAIPAPAKTLFNVLVNGIQSGVTNFSVASSAASAGRVVFGPIPVTVGGSAGGKQISYQSGQVVTGGGIAQYQFVIKYADSF